MEHYYIYCLHNDNLPEYYVGHTTNLKERWKHHKQDCKTSPCKVYKYIRDNGEYNFKMEVLDEIYCDVHEARKLERHYTELLGATLNTNVPGRTHKEYLKTYRESEHGINKTKNYYKDNKDEINEKKKEKIICICGKSLRKSDHARHFKSKKHIDFIRENIGY
jgi:predicted GIY-YIG superfamily endonuclease